MIIPVVGELWMDIDGCINLVIEETAKGYHVLELATGEVWKHQPLEHWNDEYVKKDDITVGFYCKRL